MTLQDTLINTRETLLATLLGIDRNEILNAPTSLAATHPNGKSVAVELKQAVNVFKAIAMDESGEHVDYPGLAESEVYAAYRVACSPRLRHFDPATLGSRAERLAFWINLYNALVIDAVIRFGVQKSVVEGPVGVLKFFRRAAYDVCGYRFAAEDIEHGILRGNRGNPYLPGPQFGPTDPRRAWVIDPPDPRIHFALNCASRSCPPVGVYTPDWIDDQLDLAARNFITHEMQADRENDTLHLSQIFKWYQVDFGGQAGVVDFLLRYLPDEERDWLASHRDSVRIKYERYDWGLNTKKK